jgi:hypothetical protein
MRLEPSTLIPYRTRGDEVSSVRHGEEARRWTGREGALRAMLLACAVTLQMDPCALASQARPDDRCAVVDRPAATRPDCGGAVIPPNIAPLTFVIQEKGSAYYVKIRSDKGEPLEVYSRSGEIRPGQGPWHRLLAENRGKDLWFDVYVLGLGTGAAPQGQQDAWTRFAPLRATIASEPIDDFLVYRKIRPVHSTYGDMGIYQRDLRTFKEKAVLENGSFDHGCLNCHTFCNNGTGTALLSIRSRVYGSSAILVEGDEVTKVGTKFGYSAWHPSGKLVAFSANDVRQFFHLASDEVRDVVDYDSLVATYRLSDKTVRAVPGLVQKDRLETYPTWSPDGRYLYFCSAPKTWTDGPSFQEAYDRIRYDLGRIPYDVNEDRWGEPEMLLTAADTGQSILLPRVSPDGRWLLFAMCDYGCFPVYRQSSDLYLMDLHADAGTRPKAYRRLDINSEASDSWHCWSANGRWIAFSSKRLSPLLTRVYLAYVDEQGQVHKPLLLPQQDPRFYDSCLWTFSVPELVTEPVKIRKESLGRVVRGTDQIGVKMPVTMATPKADTTIPQHDEPVQPGR